MKPVNFKTYILTLITTLLLFGVAFYLSNYVNKKKTDELKSNEDKIAIDILSFETQFNVLKESSCSTFDRTELQKELDSLSLKLTFMEQQVGKDDPEVFRLKRYYSLLEIRDYLLTKRMSDECKSNLVFVLYYYPKDDTCDDCVKEDLILKAISDQYSSVEIYTFDYDLDLPAVRALLSPNNLPKNPQELDINGKSYPAFNTLEDLQKVLTPLLEKVATSTPTTINKT